MLLRPLPYRNIPRPELFFAVGIHCDSKDISKIGRNRCITKS